MSLSQPGRQTGRPNGAPMVTLGKFVDARRAALGISYREIALRSGVSLATVHKIATGKAAQVPHRSTLDGLAVALSVPVDALLEAAAADIGLHQVAIEDADLRAIIVAAAELTPDERHAVLTIINSMRPRSGSRRH